MRVHPGKQQHVGFSAFDKKDNKPDFIKHHHHKHDHKGRAEITIATVNDDFTDKKTTLNRVKRFADVVMVQEAKNSNLRKDIDNDNFGVHQNLKSDALAGSAIVWNKNHVKSTDAGMALGVDSHGRAMLDRYISWNDIKVDGKTVRMVSVHRPPKRFSGLWNEFDKNLKKFLDSFKGPVVIGLDANQAHSKHLIETTGLKWHAPPPGKNGHASIDGFLASPGIKFENIRRLPKGTSDHAPVVADISFKAPKG